MKSLILVAGLLLPLFSQGYVRIGNAGEGVLKNDKIYVRDLYETGSHIQPWVGDSILSSIQNRWNNSLIGTRFGKSEIFLRKLTDLERLAPGMGLITLEALTKHSFIFVDKLDLVENDSDSVPDDMRIQLALRSSSGIYISREGWDKMDEVSKAALLIHEGIYSLAKLYCEQTGCYQKATSIRPFVGELFLPRQKSNFAGRLSEVLEVPSLDPICTSPLQMHVEAWDLVQRQDPYDNIDFLAEFKGDYNFLRETFARDTRQMCTQAQKLQTGTLQLVVTMTRMRPVLRYSMYTLPDRFPEGTRERTRMIVELENYTVNRFIRSKNSSLCSDQVISAAQDIYISEYSGMINPRHICE